MSIYPLENENTQVDWTIAKFWTIFQNPKVEQQYRDYKLASDATLVATLSIAIMMVELMGISVDRNSIPESVFIQLLIPKLMVIAFCLTLTGVVYFRPSIARISYFPLALMIVFTLTYGFSAIHHFQAQGNTVNLQIFPLLVLISFLIVAAPIHVALMNAAVIVIVSLSIHLFILRSANSTIVILLLGCAATSVLGYFFARASHQFRRKEFKGHYQLQKEIAQRQLINEALLESNRNIELNHSVAEAVHNAESVDSAFKVCLKQICDTLEWPIGHTYLLSNEGSVELLPSKIWYFKGAASFTTFQEVTEHTSYKSGEGLPGRVLESGKPAWIVDVTQDPNFPRARIAEDIGIKGGFAFPVVSDEGLIAVLEFFATITIEPDERLLRTMSDIGRSLGGMIIRKKAEEALRKHERLLQAVFDTIPMGIFVKNTEGRFIMANKVVASVHGMEPEEFVKYKPSELTEGTDEEKAKIEAGDTYVLESGEVLNTPEEKFTTADGEEKWVRRIKTPLIDESGQIYGLVGIREDITDRKLAEEKLRVSDRQFRELLESSPIGVSIITSDDRFIFFNSLVQERTGYSAEELRNIHASDITKSSEERQKILEMAVRQEPIQDYEIELVRKDGTSWWSLMTVEQVDFEGKRGSLTWDFDISEQKAAEEAAKKAEQLLRESIESLPDGFALFDDKDKLLICNEEFKKALPLAVNQIKPGNTYEQIARAAFYGDDLEHVPEIEARLQSRLAAHRNPTGKPDYAQLEEGRRVIRIDERRTPSDYTVGLRTDVTELFDARKKAEEATQAKSSFLAAMSHEIRTPMSGVVGMIDLLQQTKMDSDQRQMIRTVRDSAFALLGIINDILDFSKIEAGKLDLEIIPLSIRDIIEGVAQTLLPTSNKKGLRLWIYIDPEIPAWILGDPVRIRQIIFNLAGNAIKFTESSYSKQGIVTIRVDRIKSNISNMIDLRFSVTDTGIGMSLEGVESLFKPFSQAKSSTTRRFGGTGLGLSICKNLADLMEGEIGVASEEGKGSTFTFDVSLQITDVERADVEQTDLSGLRILLAIEQQPTLDFTSRYLEHSGIEISIAKQFGEVSDLLIAAQQAGNAFDILILGPSWGEKLRRQLIDSLRSSMKELRYLILTDDHSVKQGLVLPDIMVVQNSPLLRSAFILGVGVVAGRTSPDLTEDAPELRLKASKALSVEEAEALGQLVLVAEDNVTNQDVIRAQLNLLGYTAEIAFDGKEAFKLWRSKNYGLLLSDVHMPEMDGYELTAAIRKMEKDGDKRLPIIAITANALQGETEKCLQAGMDDYLAKPLELDKLKRMLSRWLPQNKNDDLPSTEKTSKASVAKKPEVNEMTSAPAIDSSALTSIFGDDLEKIRKILRDFVGAASDIVKEIEEAYTNRSAEGIQEAAHKLKSPAGTVGAMELADVCIELERAGKEGNWEIIEREEPKLTEKFGDVLVYVDGL